LAPADERLDQLAASVVDGPAVVKRSLKFARISDHPVRSVIVSLKRPGRVLVLDSANFWTQTPGVSGQLTALVPSGAKGNGVRSDPQSIGTTYAEREIGQLGGLSVWRCSLGAYVVLQLRRSALARLEPPVFWLDEEVEDFSNRLQALGSGAQEVAASPD
jgi:hypothetical protein